MTCRDIQRRLIIDLYRRSLVMPNYTPSGWFECDVCEITRSGYFREFEIKLTKSDFKADATKQRRAGYDWQTRQDIPSPTKHARLAAHDIGGPAEFYFVAPQGLIERTELPPWAGLMEAMEHKGRVIIHDVVVGAPRLHRTKISPSVATHIRSVCYYRFHNLFLKR